MPVPEHAPAVIAQPSVNWDRMDILYNAAVEAVDESVINAIVAGEPVEAVKPKGWICPAIDIDDMCRILALYGRGPEATTA